MDDSYAVTLRIGCAGQDDFPAVLKNAASIRLIDAREDLYESRFPRAILSGERMDLAGLEAKVNIAQNLYWSKTLADTAKLNDRRHAQSPY